MECGRASYRFFILAAFAHPELKAVAGATAVQSASRIFISRGEPLAHEICAQDDSAGGAINPYSLFPVPYFFKSSGVSCSFPSIS